MGKLIYSMTTSLDGFVSDPDGNFGWGAPEEESHKFINQQMRSIGTHLYGRRMYETMVYWETAHTEPEQPPFILEYARLWRAANKIVYSTTLNAVASERTRIERAFDPEAVRRLKAESDLDLRRRRSPPGGAGDPGRAGRRIPPVRRTGDRRWRQSVLPGRCARRSCAAGRAAIRQRRGLPALRRQGSRAVTFLQAGRPGGGRSRGRYR